ncbi:hypothetical protein Cgig2_025537 [Carnegiea gigantea]|uniref:BHLH domain-containing protein n=1 Tax=Carnegiea gigantea TaxID=171969 RepID=A0A9Q1KBX7_9CARY|nr:hypothetical protein Cgig2_025537 [Carnegiea gigantea]
MFPFHQRGELSFQISNYLENTSNSNSNSSNNDDNNNNNTSNIVYFDPTRVEQNASAPNTTHLNPVVVQHGRPANYRARRGRPRKPAPSNNEDQGGNDVSQRRVIHREIERQRRQEMANHFSSLRSLLPMEYIRGKRSTCDHLTEAARYIKDLEKNINELQQRKERLKGSSSSSRNNLHGDGGYQCSSSGTSYRSDCNVSIHMLSGAMDIEINARVGEEDVFPLSRALHVLIQEGLNVVDCVSSKVNQRWIYVIRCEVSDEISIDSSQLQHKLMSEIDSSDDP